MASNLCRLFNDKSIFMKVVLFQTIQFSTSTQFKCTCTLIVKNILFQAIPFSQTLIIPIIQFSANTGFVCTQLNIKTVQY